MNDDEGIAILFLRLMLLTNQMKLCGEKVAELKKVEKVLRSLHFKFNHIVMDFEESKDLCKMKLE